MFRLKTLRYFIKSFIYQVYHFFDENVIKLPPLRYVNSA